MKTAQQYEDEFRFALRCFALVLAFVVGFLAHAVWVMK